MRTWEDFRPFFFLSSGRGSSGTACRGAFASAFGGALAMAALLPTAPKTVSNGSACSARGGGPLGERLFRIYKSQTIFFVLGPQMYVANAVNL